MNKKSFFLGILTGIVLTVIVLFIIALVSRKHKGNDPIQQYDSIQYLENPVSYEGKEKASFKVFQVFDNGALAKEASNTIGDDVMFYGNTVLILGKNFYRDQVVTVEKPMRVGTYSYTNNGGIPMTVPVIEGDMR